MTYLLFQCRLPASLRTGNLHQSSLSKLTTSHCVPSDLPSHLAAATVGLYSNWLVFLSIWRGVSAIGSRRYTTQLSVGLRHTVHSSSAATIGLHIYVSLTPRVQGAVMHRVVHGSGRPGVGSGRVLK